ncbi:MAG: mRNA surveillance protein pelota [Euryarchaeota archaeon]|nr:mRNA surveillance protein pelota [Euryarchaeota archaeon]
MKLLHFDRKHGVVKLLTHTMDDLWHLYNLVLHGDMARAMTFRRGEEAGDKLRPERAEKKRMRLGVRVERVEFHEFSDTLRVHGVIEEGPQDVGQHHTLTIVPGDDIEVQKAWRELDLQRIREAEDQTAQPVMAFAAIDDDEAVIALLRQYGVQEVARVQSNRAGKDYEQKGDTKGTFLAEVHTKLAQSGAQAEAILIIGPGFAKEDLYAFIKEKDQAMLRRCHVISTGQSGMQAVHEVLKSGIGGKVIGDSRVGLETTLVEELMTRMGKGGAVTYGQKEVGDALKAGAVETLLISDSTLREKGSEQLLHQADQTRCKVVVISTVHEAGKRLEAIGGWGALLRYRME